MKKRRVYPVLSGGYVLKIFKVMRLGIWLLLLSTFSLQAVGFAQKAKVTLSMEQCDLLEIIRSIRKVSDYRFLYKTEELQRYKHCDLHVKEAGVDEVMTALLKGTDLIYSISEGVILIQKRKGVPVRQVTEVVIVGKVTDRTGQTLPGVTVQLKGTSVGTVTDTEGAFRLPIPKAKEMVLVFSFVGMKTLEVAYKEGQTLNVVLEENVKEMEEVVVTGYFNKNKHSFTGSAQTYTSDELKQVNPVNVLTALSILDPSFKMVENNMEGSNPNVIPDFEIRGVSSVPGTDLKSDYDGSPNMPTFILDGFEVSAEKVFDMDPMRIESITILKDAAATAIYGSRASNGVVVMNTKQPEPGRIRVTYNLDLSFNLPDLRDYDLLNAREKLELEKAAGYFDPVGTGYQTEARQQAYNAILKYVERGYNTYWLDKPVHTAVGHKHSLSVEGGENAMRYALDLTYEQAPGVMRESGRNRIGMGVMLLYRFKNVTFKNQMTYDNVRSENTPYGSFQEYARLNPYYAYKDENGHYLQLLEKADAFTERRNVPNPLYNTRLNVINESSYSEFVNNFSMDWYITGDLRLKGNVAVRHRKNDGTVFKPAKHTDFRNYTDFYRKGYYEATSGKGFGYDGNIVLSYFKQLDAHVWNANVVWNLQSQEKEEYTVRAEGFQDEKLDYISFATQYAENMIPVGRDEVSRLMGVVANFSYSYRDCYLFDLSGRMDGSSKFGADSRWAPFWSAGAGWNISSEQFAENWQKVDLLKLRASYGITGSQAFDPYQALMMYTYYTKDRYLNHIGATMMGLANPELKWQQTSQLNVGADVALWHNRMVFTFNYYRNMSRDLLEDVTLPPSLGFVAYKENLGKILNEGYEVNVKVGVLQKKDAYINLIFSGVHNKNTLKKISNSLTAWNDKQDEELESGEEETRSVPKVKYAEGQSIHTIWAVPSLGINPASGDEIFIDRNGRRTDSWNARDQRPMGCTDAELEGNIGLNAGYKGLQLSVYCRYRIGGQTYNQTLVDRVENADKLYNTDRRVLEARWQRPGDVTFFKDVRDHSRTQPTSRFIQDYSYLQMSSLNLSYDLPARWLRKVHMEGCRLSFSMNDVFRRSTVREERGLSYPFARAFRTSLRVIF